MFGVGILGLGYWYGAYRLARALQEHDRAKLIAIYDEQPKNTSAFTKVFGGYQASSPEEIVNRNDVDIVFIAAHSKKIPEYGCLAASKNKHLIIGKPIASSLNEADRFVEAVEKSGSKIVTMEVYDSALMPLKKSKVISLITSGQIGKIVRIQSISHSSIAESWYCSGQPGWFADPEKSPGGAFIDYAIYDMEVLKYIANSSVKQVHFSLMKNLIHKNLPVEDWGIAYFCFENGIEASMEASWTIVTPNITQPSPKVNSYSRFEIIGTQGRIIYDLLPYEHVSILTQSYPYWADLRIVRSKTASEPPIFGPLEHLIKCIVTNQEPLAGIREARNCLADIINIYSKATILKES